MFKTLSDIVVIPFQPKDASQKMQAEMRDFLLEVGFRYFHVLGRMKDLDEGMVKRNSKSDVLTWNSYLS